MTQPESIGVILARPVDPVNADVVTRVIDLGCACHPCRHASRSCRDPLCAHGSPATPLCSLSPHPCAAEPKGRVDLADEGCEVEHPGARPVRRAPVLLIVGERLVDRRVTRDILVTESTARRGPDSGRRVDSTRLCRLAER
jgi:hypothetical protein